ncbi:MAG: hypothetical protein FWG94_12100 [Oscillospiraceae bacterium]|nr:hypothetical protein [Oscillospiraceae bacterium]
MSKKSLMPHVSDNLIYTMDNDKRKFIVTPVYAKDGENVCDILLKLIYDENTEQTS